MTVTWRGERRAKQRRNASESRSQRENKTNKSGAKRSLRGQPKHCAKHQMNVTLFPLDCIVNGEHAVQVNDLFLSPLVLCSTPLLLQSTIPSFLHRFFLPSCSHHRFRLASLSYHPRSMAILHSYLFPHTTYRLPTNFLLSSSYSCHFSILLLLLFSSQR